MWSILLFAFAFQQVGHDRFVIDPPGALLGTAWRDADANGLVDLWLASVENGKRNINLYIQQEEGGFPTEPSHTFGVPSAVVGWAVGDFLGGEATTLRANFDSTATTMKVQYSKEFPDEGRALVNSKEIISYTVNDRASNELRGITRGLEGTDSEPNFAGYSVEVISNDPAFNGGVNLNSSKPRLEFFKIPIVW